MFLSILLLFLIQLNAFSYGYINCNDEKCGQNNNNFNQINGKFLNNKNVKLKSTQINDLLENYEFISQSKSFINSLYYQFDANNTSNHYLELALFLDYYAYNNMKQVVENHDEINELILAFVNQLQAIYYKTSFGAEIHITLVKIEILDKSSFDNFNGNRDKFLESFCEFQEKLNPKSDSNALHWDMAVLLTGLDLYVINANGFKDYRALGLGSINGICSNDRNCVIAEFASNYKLGTYWPSSGLMSTWITAHEMAHNFGILHDGQPFNSDCASNLFLMSSSRSYSGQTSWSKCSANNFQQLSNNLKCLNDIPKYINKNYNHRKYMLMPGLVWNADIQCKLFLSDTNAFQYYGYSGLDICEQTMLCNKPNIKQFIKSGPALDGTMCGRNSVCINGQCRHWPHMPAL